MTAVKLTAPGMNEALASVRAKAARARNLGPVLAVIAGQVDTAIHDSFRTRTAFDGSAFAPNAVATIERKKSSKPLRDKGFLEDNTHASPNGPASIGIGTNVPYAGAAIYGSRRTGVRKEAVRDRHLGSYRRKRRAGPVRERPAGPWAVTVPMRNPFPVTQTGQWIATARGALLRDKITRTLSGYIASGRVG